jgi:riboflavin kinase / FMN adenylyltransferase
VQVLDSYGDLAIWAAGRPVYVAVGFFDGVHLGHRHLLERLCEAAAAVGALPLALTFVNSPRHFHRRELDPEDWHFLTMPDEKLELLADTGVAATLMLTYEQGVASQTAAGFLQGLNAHAPLAGLAVGYDTSIGRDMVSGPERFAALGAELGIGITWIEPLLLDGQPVKSSLARDLVAGGDMPGAMRVLGRRYFIGGAVVPGKGVGGSALGLHTANVLVPPQKLTPPAGIYAGCAMLEDGRAVPAALSLQQSSILSNTVVERTANGNRPSPTVRPVNAANAIVLEAHLLDFRGDLYGRRLRVEFSARLRDWRDYDSVADLSAQLQLDIAQTRQIAREAQP